MKPLAWFITYITMGLGLLGIAIFADTLPLGNQIFNFIIGSADLLMAGFWFKAHCDEKASRH